jgi:hypothetical protein
MDGDALQAEATADSHGAERDFSPVCDQNPPHPCASPLRKLFERRIMPKMLGLTTFFGTSQNRREGDVTDAADIFEARQSRRVYLHSQKSQTTALRAL